MQTIRVSLTGPVGVALLLLCAACGKKGEQVSDTTAAGGAVAAPSASSVQVADVTLGKRVDTNKRAGDQTDTFKPGDTIYASVHTTGSGPGTQLVARWTFQDGQQVDERTETIAPTGDAYTEFHIAKPTGFPVGKYTLHILMDGKEVQTKDFTVQK